MADPALTVTHLRSPIEPERVVVLVPGLGTDVAGTWAYPAERLDAGSHVMGLDLPGHGRSPAWGAEPSPTITQLARAVDAAVRAELERTGLATLPVHFAGISLAGGLALQLGLEHAEIFSSVAVVCSAAKIGQSTMWRERAALVRSQGTETLVDGSVARWFAADFPATHPGVVEQLKQALRGADDASYALLCETLVSFDLSDRLGEITLPVLVIAGEEDTVTTADDAAAIGTGVDRSAVHILADAAHQAPTEKPAQVAGLLNDFFV